MELFVFVDSRKPDCQIVEHGAPKRLLVGRFAAQVKAGKKARDSRNLYFQ